MHAPAAANMDTTTTTTTTTTQSYDAVLVTIIDYVYSFSPQSSTAWRNAKLALLDALGCAIESLEISNGCARLVGPVWPGEGSTAERAGDGHGFRLPGTKLQLDPLKGAFDLGAMIRYLDHNDAFPGSEWGHPSDNLGAILAVGDCLHRSRKATPASTSSSTASSLNGESENGTAPPPPPPTMRTILEAMIKAYEIQGCFQIANAFNKLGIDHTILVKIASTAVVSWILGLPRSDALSALSHAFIDGHPLRTYRQAPNAGPRKGWAAGDACMRAVHLALLARAGQPGVPTALTQPKWGFYDVLFKGQEFKLPKPFGTWVMENICFKVHTAEGHGLTAVEAALLLGSDLRSRGLSPERDIAHIQIRTQGPAMTIIDKRGCLHNSADRDHCMRYMVAVVILKGAMVSTSDYQDDSVWASSPAVEQLRAKMDMAEDPSFTAAYHDPKKRTVSNGLTVTLTNGQILPEVLVECPLGHPWKEETVPAVKEKTRRNLSLRLDKGRVEDIVQASESQGFEDMPISDFVDMFTP